MALDVMASRRSAAGVEDPDDFQQLTVLDRWAFRRAGVTPDFRGAARWHWLVSLFARFHPDDDLIDDTPSDAGIMWVLPDAVRKLARILEEHDTQTLIDDNDSGWDVEPELIDDLRLLFRVCARRGLGLVKWS